jgi:hypothetical protein
MLLMIVALWTSRAAWVGSWGSEREKDMETPVVS